MSGRIAARLSLLAAVSLLALGMASCGGDDDAGTQGAPPAQERGEGGAPRDEWQGQNGSGRTNGAAQQGQDRPGGDTSARFTPREHSDSGGGAQQFRVPGGDNSVQEFGEEAGGGEFEAAAAALHNFFDARAQRAWRAACRHLAAGLVASLEGRSSPDAEPQMSCARGLAQMTNPDAIRQLRAEARAIDVGSLRAEGDRGFILYRGEEGTVHAIAMEREDGEWKVANLAGLPLG